MTPFEQLKRRFPQLIPIPELRDNVSIIQLALHHGYQLQPQKGKTRPVLTHPNYQDTIIIKYPAQPGQQLYQRAGDFTDAGTIIDFVRHRLTTVFARFNHLGQHQLTNITQVLYDYLRVDPKSSTIQQQPTFSVEKTNPSTFQPTEFDLRPIEPVNYLLERAIKPATWQTPEFAGKVWTQVTYFDQQAGHSVSFAMAQAQPQRAYRTFHNVAFPYHNSISDEVSGLEIRNHGLKQHATGSDRSTSVFVSNAPVRAARFYIMESVIDALSHFQLKYQQGDHPFENVYFSTGGQLTLGQISTILGYINRIEKTSDWQLYLSFDNDLSGHRYDLQFVQQLVSTQLPLTSMASTGNHITYQLSQQEQNQLLQVALVSKIEHFNHQLAIDSIHHSTPNILSQPITIDRTHVQTQFRLPYDCNVIAFFTWQLLDITRLSQRVIIHKSVSDDFNSDLMSQ